MEFCPKCGSVFIEKNKKSKCARCNYTSKDKIKLQTSEKIEKLKKIGVIKEKETDIFPTMTAVCSKCGNREAYFWSAQTRAADEAETRFYRCTKCKHTWREYS